MSIAYDVEVIFHFTDKDKLFEGYRPAHKIKDDYLTTGLHHYDDINGDTSSVKGAIAFLSPELYPDCLRKGKKIEMYDGSRYIGYAEVVKILDPVLENDT